MRHFKIAGSHLCWQPPPPKEIQSVDLKSKSFLQRFKLQQPFQADRKATEKHQKHKSITGKNITELRLLQVDILQN